MRTTPWGFSPEQIVEIAKNAGKAILDIYTDESKFNIVDFKADDSPLTLADDASQEVIAAALGALTPNIPILSEESTFGMEYDVRSKWNMFWCVDPLDGTKEFIKRNGEFTVNIALIMDKKPVFSVIYVPAKDITYYTVPNDGCYKIADGNITKIAVRNKKDNPIAVRSKSHAAPEEEELLTKYGSKDFISVGSSLKFCMVAEGVADMYYRHGPTMEWDTAAGQAIVEAAGGKVYHGNNTESEFRYNKQDLRNGSFLVLGF